jgi:cellulose biosynthesis protein BcsQ
MPEPSPDPVGKLVQPVPPLVLAIASGKGGVGKTMLTVACAYELSLGGPTLVIDLDFFNRGLSGLFRGRKEIGLIARPRFLDPAEGPPAPPWSVVEVEHQLYHIAYPDLVPDELLRLENRTPEDLAHDLRDLIQRAGQLCGARSIVLDCHGGPDHTSFAAALLADHTLLISEPDRITLHGTLNFLRQLQRGADPAHADVRLVFNKIVPGFRTPFLYRFYDQSLRETFGGKDLLGIFPLELPLSKAFEETPLITRSYPYSLFARKMRVLILDLLGERARHYLAPSAPTLPNWVRSYRRRTLGRIPWLIDQNVILQFMIFAVFVFVVVGFVNQRFVAGQQGVLEKALILITLAEHPEITLPPESSFRQMLTTAKVELMGGHSKPPPLSLEAYTFQILNRANHATTTLWVLNMEANEVRERALEKATRDGDSVMKQRLLSGDLREPLEENREFVIGPIAAAEKVLRPYLQDSASELAKDATGVDLDIVYLMKPVIWRNLKISQSDFSNRDSLSLIGKESTVDWKKAYDSLAADFDRLPAPAEFQAEWKAVSRAVHAPTRLHWISHALVLWWQRWYWQATIIFFGWLSIAFFLDYIRKIDAAFVRALHTNYYHALLWFGLALLMWGPTVIYIINNMSSQSGGLDPNERRLSSWLILLLYLFITGHEIYRCWRLLHDRRLDLTSSDVATQMQARNFRSHLAASPALLSEAAPLTMELYLRGFAVLVLCGGLVAFFVIAFLGR